LGCYQRSRGTGLIIKNEKLFVEFFDPTFMPEWRGTQDELTKLQNKEYSPNDTGREQFFDCESKGIKPTSPDLYVICVNFKRRKKNDYCRGSVYKV
jgi:hypothetical protein